MSVRYIPFESKSGFKSPNFLVNPDGYIVGKGLVLTENLDVQSITLSGVELLTGIDSTVSLSEGIKNSFLERLGTLQYLDVDGDFIVSQASTPYISVINGEIRITNPQSITTQLYENINQLLPGSVNNTSGVDAVFNVTRFNGSYDVEIVNPGRNFLPGDYIIIPGTFVGGESPENDLRINIVTISPAELDLRKITSVSAVGSAVAESCGSMNNVDVGVTTPARGRFTDIISIGDIAVSDNASVGGNLSVVGNTIIVGNTSVSGNITIAGTGQFDSIRVEEAPSEDYHVTRKDYVDKRISAFSIAFGG